MSLFLKGNKLLRFHLILSNPLISLITIFFLNLTSSVCDILFKMCQKQLEVELPTRRRELAMIETNNYNAHHNVHNQAPNSSLHFDGPKFYMCIMPLQHLKYNQLYRSITSRCNCTFFDITTRSTLELQSDYRSLIMREPPSFPLVHTTKEF